MPPPLSQPCASDAECADFGLKCDPLRGCVACVFDWHCADGERCTNQGCQVPTKCLLDEDCSEFEKSPHCDPVISECVGCRFESDCPASSHCIERSCSSYTACVNSRDCADGTVCDRDAGECVECLTNGDCSQDTEVCVDTHCVPTCESDKDCVERNQLCHHQKGYCADCVEQEDCPAIYYCAADLCKLDICKVGSSTCEGAIVKTCNALGSDYDRSSCPLSTTCTVVGDVASCQPWICTPGTLDCDPTGQLLQECSADGLSIQTQTDCAAEDKLCYLGQCRPKVCEPGSLFCVGQEAHECSANGTASAVRATCVAGTYCVDGSATCALQVCVPGAAQCDGPVATKCNDLGSGLEPDGTDCEAEDESCFGGACKPRLCDAPFCQDGNAWACLENGTLTELSDTCLPVEFCAGGVCLPDQCSAGSAVCSGETATTCKADGSGPDVGGTDCTSSNQVCVAGACQPVVCLAGSYYCANGHPQLCNNRGTAPTRQTDTCSANEYCSPGSSVCAYDVCVGGANLCSGHIATTCAADGSGPAAGGTDCEATGKVCDSGACLPKVCNPSEYFCQAGNVYRCGATGATSSLIDTCLAGEFCQAGATTCKVDLCTAGAPTCNADKLSTCAADGSGPANAGTDCGANKVCDAGACKNVICTLNALTCTADAVQQCVAKGTAWVPTEPCAVTSFCNELASPITCSPDTCEPAANACNGEKLATCAADGGHFSVTGTDCSATQQVCTLAGACAAEAVDTVGDITVSATVSSYLSANIYRVDRARTLTEIEQYISVTGTSVFTWVVYEGSNYFDTFTKVAEVTTSGSGAAVFHSSGSLSVPLQAGKYYLIGVMVQGSHTRFSVNTALRPFVSFGQLFSSYSVSGATAPATYYVSSTPSVRYNQRLSTAEGD